MKNICLLFIALFVCITVNAQDKNYKGPAKLYVNSFWQMSKIAGELVEKGNTNASVIIVNMEKSIVSIKEKDAVYDITTMNAEVKRLRELLRLKQQTYTNEQGSEPAQNEKEQLERKDTKTSGDAVIKRVNELLTFLFDGNKDDHVPAAMKAKTEEILTLDMSGNKGALKVWLGRLKKNAEEAKVRYPKLEKICREQTKLIEAQNYYRHFQSYQSYWDAAQKIFPDENNFRQAYDLITGILNGLGTEADLQALIAKNSAEKIKETRLPAAKVKDAALERLFMDAFDKMYGASFKGKAVKAIVVSDDWQIQRNEVTGIVTGRLRKGAIVYNDTEGQCRLVEEFFIQQEYVGNSFTGTKSVYAVGKGQEMLCDYVK